MGGGGSGNSARLVDAVAGGRDAESDGRGATSPRRQNCAGGERRRDGKRSFGRASGGEGGGGGGGGGGGRHGVLFLGWLEERRGAAPPPVEGEKVEDGDGNHKRTTNKASGRFRQRVGGGYTTRRMLRSRPFVGKPGPPPTPPAPPLRAFGRMAGCTREAGSGASPGGMAIPTGEVRARRRRRGTIEGRAGGGVSSGGVGERLPFLPREGEGWSKVVFPPPPEEEARKEKGGGG